MIKQLILYYLFGVFTIVSGGFVSGFLFWTIRDRQTRRKLSQCTKCGGPTAPMAIGPVCPGCAKQIMDEHGLACEKESQTDFVEKAKTLYKDPEFQKSLRQTMGITIDKDLFDDDAEKEQTWRD